MKFLFISNVARRRELGAARIHIELGEELRELGHEVDEFTADDAFRTDTLRILRPFARAKIDFARRAHRFIAENGHKYDVIDAIESAIALPKNRFGFKGLVAVRSTGLTGLYAKILDRDSESTGTQSFKTRFGNLLRELARRRNGAIDYESFRSADIMNVVNPEERDFLQRDWKLGPRCVELPYGISADRLLGFRQNASIPDRRLTGKVIAFVGMWQPRKGSRDFSKIIRMILRECPSARFCFLGTRCDEDVVLSDVGVDLAPFVKVVAEYRSDELPTLLGPCALGVFPSYVESFGFAVLEKLASGLPTFAYKSPGPPVMLNECPFECLVAPGDTGALAEKLLQRLQYGVSDYTSESEACLQVAERFDWRRIAENTVEIYKQELARVVGASDRRDLE